MFSIMINFRDFTRGTVEYRVPSYNAHKIEGGCLFVNLFPKNEQFTPNGAVIYPMDLIASVTIVEIEE